MTEIQIQKWSDRLSELSWINSDLAYEIAEMKILYKIQKISELEAKQEISFSDERKKLIQKLRRRNPLRRIKDKKHSYLILFAYYRHTQSDYEFLLSKWKQIRNIDTRKFARSNFTFPSF